MEIPARKRRACRTVPRTCLVLIVSVLAQGLSAQTASDPGEQRSVSWKRVIPNIVSDQKQIWTFPVRTVRGSHWVATLGVVGITAGLIAADPHDTPSIRRTNSFDGFNSVVSGKSTDLGAIIAPVSLYVAGLIRKDSYQQKTALLAGEAVADAEIVTVVLKGATSRLRPWDVPASGDFGDTWFQGKGNWLRGHGSFPSGHTIAAFSVATVISRRYPNRRWVPYVAYSLAALVGFSRITSSAHFPSDVFMGAALGYSISRFSVIR